MTLDLQCVREFAERCTAAWCSHDTASGASLYSASGSLTIDEGTPSVGRAAIAAAAQDSIATFPDLAVPNGWKGDPRRPRIYRWILEGTKPGPGGTGKKVPIRGEQWRRGSGGLIAESQRHVHGDDENTRKVQIY